MKTIGFIGLGLIGGSIAKTIRKFHPDYRLIAFDKDRSALAEAVSLNVINGICDIEDEQLYNCDYLFLCAPVEFNVEYMEKIKASLGENCILTDVGSVKNVIHEKVTELGLEGRFIGGHPMAGSERSGFSNSSDHLLENAYYIITPGGEVALEKISDFTELISSLGAIPLVITAEEHDFITAGVSHLPHIVASALVNLVNLLDNDAQYMKMIAAGGFRDITRIASSSPVMWEQICLENQKNISTVLDEFIRMLIQIRCSIDNKEADNIFDMFASSKDYRDSIDIIDNSLIPRSYVLYIDVADEAGAIATIATILATEKVNIKNIGIIHNREFEDGVLKIEFYTDAALEQAKVLLTKRNYKICER
ncbi:prephenate dehydrogenase [Blautia massiliensis]|jgi:prephenate dehydrogenase|uniref:prephenate dehydrogenase n=1 Tax=Blautia TaxID=572511 RepID=UPI000D725C47|nr:MULTISPECIES: prephenate dehydrogenase [Blautia]RHP71297.1 prephenate dehydrogenase [Ruminococcus sp. OF02-6]MCC2725585.1 prephenate dehydrogenase [Blautia sp. MSK22_86]MCJ7860917.1 prephenate dehydrogenase [Blautia sp. NSJ-157]MCJ7864016.1 prephenate dehydrogenase [Blautia sp. NSJ-140]NSF56709.1 prephenate dehydrogenase [Blautia massiliensis (ex Durand et al. 2017)]